MYVCVCVCVCVCTKIASLIQETPKKITYGQIPTFCTTINPTAPALCASAAFFAKVTPPPLFIRATFPSTPPATSPAKTPSIEYGGSFPSCDVKFEHS